MTKRVKTWFDWTAVALVLWAALSFIPMSWIGFSPGSIVVETRQNPPMVHFHRHIWRDMQIRYSVVVRNAETLAIACEGSSGPFMYRAQPAGTAMFSLTAWSAGQCGALPNGDYVMDTTWTHYLPLPFVLPRTATVRAQFRLEQSE